ncbi:zincin [Tothia fuscella]|uniref:Zincin n=1 Tax=Tothia fuscella TaxID=1048955 RepID=A0A9P4NZ03_9PEZI|nr:zincin [Tothia fuscella]
MVRTPPQIPLAFEATPTSIEEDMGFAIEKSRQVQPSHILVFYKDVSPDPQVRNALRKAKTLLDDFAVETAMCEKLFCVVNAVTSKSTEDLDPESLHFLQKKKREFIRSGIDIPIGPKRDRFKEIASRLSHLSNDFGQNIAASSDDTGVWFTLQELNGVPQNVLSALENGQGDFEGKLRVSFRYPDLFPTLKHAKNGDTRKRLYIANENKCNQNIPLLKEAVALRDEAARDLHGYRNHAAFRLEDMMAKSPDVVNTFLDELEDMLTAGGNNELEELKKFNTVDGMFQTFHELFGLVYEELDDQVDRTKLKNSGVSSSFVWHEDVKLYIVWDQDDDSIPFIGYLYLDLYPRQGKYNHAAAFNLTPGFTREDGSRSFPATALVCNFSKPTPNRPSLLKHDEMIMLFHELGPAVHDLVSKTTYARFHGFETVIDFGEAPSQMLENWGWTPLFLSRLGRHYSYLSENYVMLWQAEQKVNEVVRPPERIPDETVNNLLKAKYVNSALFNLRQVALAKFDLAIHQPENHEAIKNISVSSTFNSVCRTIVPIAEPNFSSHGDDWGHGAANFPHVMGEYHAGYYSYLFSKVYSTDMFYSFFKADPMNRNEGRRYRYTVLEKGGSQDEMKTLIEYFGRPPKSEAFYEELGLS